MTYSLTFEIHDDHLKAHLKAAAITPRIALAYMTEIYNKCISTGRSHLLLVHDVLAVLPVVEYFDLAEKTAAVFKRIKVAYLNRYPEFRSELEFFCLASNNRGANYRVFSDLWRAEKWLKKRTTTSPSIPSYSFFLSQATA